MGEIIREVNEEGNKTYLEYVTDQVKEKFDKYEPCTVDYFLLPKNWFKGKKEFKWEHQIEVSCNKTFT